MKLGLVGYGYWGKILHNSIQKSWRKEIVIFDSAKNMGTIEEIYKCSHVFIATPASTHRELVDDLLSRKINVFCEKPLVLNKTLVNSLYSLAYKNKKNLFVDWTFTFNEAINLIKEKIENGEWGKIRSITMNRLNSGPERRDVSAKWDLSSHDVSIIQYLFNEFPQKITWIEKKRDPRSFQNDTAIGILEYSTFDALIHSSWSYSEKDRKCVFEFDNGIVRWDDTTNEITIDGHKIEFTPKKSPLENAIQCFLNGGTDQKILTTNITEIVETNSLEN